VRTQLAIAAWLAAGSVALAQQPVAVAKPPTPQPTPEQIAAAKAAGERIIERYQAGDLFVTIPGAPNPSIRHKASGLMCSFNPGDPVQSIQIYPSATRGDDVSCGSKVGDFVITLYATRVGAGVSADSLMPQAVSAIKDRHADLAPWSGKQIAKMSGGPDVPEAKTLRMEYAENGQKVFTRLSIAVFKDWMIEERETGPLDPAISSGDVIGEALFHVALLSVVHPEEVNALYAGH
jgi:hypothetical protein